MTDGPPSGHGDPVPPSRTGAYADAVAWGTPSTGESRIPPLAAIALAIALQVVLPNRLIEGLGPRFLVPALEAALLVAVAVANPHRVDRAQSNLRLLSLAMIALISAANVVALVELIRALLDATTVEGRSLVFVVGAHLADQRHRLRALVLGARPRRGHGPHAARPPPSRLPLPPDVRPRRRHRDGRRSSSTTSTRRSPTPPPSARPTPCRSPRGRNCS